MKKALCLLILAGMVGLAWLACNEQASYVYAGRLFDPDADCLYPSAALDLVLGPAPDPARVCDAECITEVDGEVFLSATCPPVPVEFYGAAKAPTCGRALAARCRECSLDGGGVQVVCDAGPEEDGVGGP